MTTAYSAPSGRRQSMTFSGLRSRCTIPRSMRDVEACGHVSYQPSRLIERDLPHAVRPIGQDLPFETGHDDIDQAIARIADTDDVADIRMGELHARLASRLSRSIALVSRDNAGDNT